jgi:hypothetical protein
MSRLVGLRLVLLGGCVPLDLVDGAAKLHGFVCGTYWACGITLPERRPVCPAGVDAQAVTWCRVQSADDEPSEPPG